MFMPLKKGKKAMSDHIENDNIKGKIVVITGASSGLGAEAARHLARAGAKLVLGARRLDRLEQLRDELGLEANAVVKTDVTHNAEVEALVARAIDIHGRIDVMLNNAGVMPVSLIETRKIDEWDRMIDVNIKGVLYGIGAALPHMKAQQSGHIVNVSSVAGHKVRPGNTIYAATKHAVRTISEGLRQEVKSYNIRTTILSPGAVESELPNSISAPEIAEATRKLYDNVAIPADSFARCLLFALSQPPEVDINEILFRPTRQEF